VRCQRHALRARLIFAKYNMPKSSKSLIQQIIELLVTARGDHKTVRYSILDSALSEKSTSILELEIVTFFSFSL
jgi:hypothetical protein